MKNIFPTITTLSIFLILSCSGSDSSQPDNGLSETYPTDLVLTSPFATGDAVEGLTKLRGRSQQISQTPLSPPDYDEKKAEILSRLEGASAEACKFNLVLFREKLNVSCYGPNLSFENHPDGASSSMFDTDMNGSFELPSGDVGLWSALEPSTSEPCVVAKINSIVSEAQAYVQTAQDLFSSMLCLAKVKQLDALPEKNKQIDLKTAFDDIKSQTLPLNISSATVERLDDIGTSPLYQSRIVGQIDGGTLGAVNLSVRLQHLPTALDNSTYKGRLWFTFGGGGYSTPDFHCAGGNSELLAGSIVYEKTSNERINYHFERAQYCVEAEADPFDDQNSLDPANQYASPSNLGGWASNFTDIRADFNPSTLLGTFSAAWQAGTGDSHTRVFLAKLEDAGETYAGCGYYGFGPEAADADLGKIDGMICNWAGPGNMHTPLPKVQRQCVSYDRTNKKWENTASELKISYAPVNSCAIDTTPGFTSGIATIDARTSIADELLPLTELTVTAPTPPSAF